MHDQWETRREREIHSLIYRQLYKLGDGLTDTVNLQKDRLINKFTFYIAKVTPSPALCPADRTSPNKMNYIQIYKQNFGRCMNLLAASKTNTRLII